MNKKKIMSLIMALVMLVGVFSPLTAFAGGEENAEAGTTAKAKAGTVVAGTSDQPQTTKVTLHKLKLTSLDNVPKQKDGEDFIEGLRNEEGKNAKEKYVGGKINSVKDFFSDDKACLLYTSPSPRDRTRSRMPSSA